MQFFKNIFLRMKLPAHAFGLCLVLAIAWLQQSGIGRIEQLVQRAESIAYDVRLNASLSGSPSTDEQVVIVTVDEKSLKEQGHWPWPRTRLAQMISTLFDHGAAVIGFDIMFAEAQQNSAEQLIRQLERNATDNIELKQQLTALIPEVDHDITFASSLEMGDSVLGYSYHHDASVQQGQLPPSLGSVSNKQRPSLITKMPSYTGSVPLLQTAATHGGFVTTFPDDDGILRRSPMLIRYGNELYSSLSLEMARLFFLIDEVGINMATIGDVEVVESITLGSIIIPTDGEGRAIIPFRSKSPAFKYVSATDILEKKIELSQFENKIVLVGATALGLSDQVATPVQSVYPGVEVHATLIASILDKRFPVEPGWASGANLMVILVAGCVLAMMLPVIGPVWQLAVTVITGIGLVISNTWLWQESGLVLHLAMPLLLVLSLAVFNLAYGFLSESRQRGQIKEMFGHYVPPTLVDQMIKHPDEFTMAGESREMTVLFADIRNFTTLSEGLAPDELKLLLNNFFTHMTKIIFEKHGTIDKYVGDMIMAFWGAPLHDDLHAAHGVEAALEMQAKVDQLKAEYDAKGFPEVNIGIGLNTGIMNVGDMGSEYHRAYTVIGDTVNLASRLEGLTKYYGAGIVVGEDTRENMDHIVFRKLDRVKVKGKTSAVEVYQPLCFKENAGDALLEELGCHYQALELYWKQQWKAAQEIFEGLKLQSPSTLIYQLYIERIAELSKGELPADWDGVYERRTK